ncbi:MAG: hypothetical protein U0K71_04215 [Paludibacteraceae bacterium]|nr:hypothetical protein [Paludibacteraceae bacterium]
MLHSSNAINAAQQFNRNQWLKYAENILSEQIMAQARQGLRSINVCLHTITRGAENLAEVGEMCTLLHKTLTNQGYTVKYSIDGSLTISW